MSRATGYGHGRSHLPKTVEEAIRLRDNGLSVAKIQEITGVPFSTLSHWFYRKKGHWQK